MENNGMVTITIEEYATLIQNQDFLEMLINAIYDNCKLSWDKEKITFDTDSLAVMMKIGNAYRYERTLKSLIEAEKEKEQLHE